MPSTLYVAIGMPNNGLSHHRVAVKYHWLSAYMIKCFKTKLKSPRKSHYKKDDQAVKAFLKTSCYIKSNLNKGKFEDVNLYFQDESSFGLMTHLGKCLTLKGVKPVVSYQHKFQTTYLYGSYSPINGDRFVWEINGVNTTIFESYLRDFSEYKPKE